MFSEPDRTWSPGTQGLTASYSRSHHALQKYREEKRPFFDVWRLAQLLRGFH